MEILRVNSDSIPKMETKWFRVIFSKEEKNVHDEMYEFSNYVSSRENFNKDNHFINCFSSHGEITYERILKTNSILYLEELKLKYNLIEINKPENILDRMETSEQIEVLESVLKNKTLAKIVPEGYPTFREFTAEIVSFDDVRLIFKNPNHIDGLNKIFGGTLGYWSIFKIEEVAQY